MIKEAFLKGKISSSISITSPLFLNHRYMGLYLDAIAAARSILYRAFN